jgi:hypothetical protein
MKRIERFFALFCLFGYWLPFANPTRAEFEWPSVAPLSKSYKFEGVDEGAEPRVDLIIRSVSGKPLYRLLCHSGNYAGGPDEQYKGEADEFSGVIDCHLLSLYFEPKDYGSLLPYDPLDRSVHFDRAPLSAPDVLGKCADYPEYGVQRRFRLRGMEIQFRYLDIVFSKAKTKDGIPPIRSFRLDIDVKRDRSAITAIAEPVDVQRPPALPNGLRDCEHVVHWHVPGVVTSEYLKEDRLEPPYAEVRAMQKKEIFENNQFELSIETVSGQKAYQFSCLDRDPWGIECGLFLPGSKVNLLADSVDPYSHLERSTFLENQLRGACANYPEWGSERTFTLRHMKLSIEFNTLASKPSRREPKKAETVNNDLQISVKVEPDSSADSPVAPPPKYAYWGYLPIRNACAARILAPR